MKAILEACLCEPPSELAAFRDVSLFLACSDMITLIECPNEMKDMYYRYLKKSGAFDYIEDILAVEEKESGTRIYQNKCILPVRLYVSKITFENEKNIVHNVLKT